jgi:ankyrin repeat protein
MLQAGAHLNSGMPDNPLTAAASAGLTDIIKCLLEAGANANITDGVSLMQPEFSIF